MYVAKVCMLAGPFPDGVFGRVRLCCVDVAARAIKLPHVWQPGQAGPALMVLPWAWWLHACLAVSCGGGTP